MKALLASLLATAISMLGAAEYPVMCWTYYRFEDRLDDDFTIDSWVKLGINRPMTPVVDGKTDKAAFRRFLDKCHAAGLKVYVHDNRIATAGTGEFCKNGDEEAYRQACREVRNDWSAHPAVAGFYVFDEPEAAESDRVFRAARIQREEMPDKEPYLNLLPWFDWIGKHIGAEALAPYLDRAVKESGLGFLGYDCYTQQCGTEKGLGDYFHNLREWMELGQRSGCRWNTTLLCVPHFAYQIDSCDDFRWQISTAVAMGANGICWFHPDHHMGYSMNYRNAPISPLGERTDTFAWMSEEMRLFQRQYGDFFATAKIEAAAMAGRSYGGIGAFRGDEDLRAIGADAEFPLLVSFFRGADGLRYATVVSLNKADSHNVKLTFARNVRPFQKRWSIWKELVPSDDAGLANATGETSGTQSIQLYLAPGQLVLVRLARKE